MTKTKQAKKTTAPKAKNAVDFGDLSVVERMAVAKATKTFTSFDSAVSKVVASGTYEGELTIRVKFKLVKEEPYETAPTVDLLSKAAIAKAVVMSGIQADNFYAALKKVALASYKAGKPVADMLEDTDKRVIDKIEAMQQQVVAQLPLAQRAGRTIVQAEIERVTGGIETEVDAGEAQPDASPVVG